MILDAVINSESHMAWYFKLNWASDGSSTNNSWANQNYVITEITYAPQNPTIHEIREVTDCLLLFLYFSHDKVRHADGVFVINIPSLPYDAYTT